MTTRTKMVQMEKVLNVLLGIFSVYVCRNKKKEAMSQISYKIINFSLLWTMKFLVCFWQDRSWDVAWWWRDYKPGKGLIIVEEHKVKELVDSSGGGGAPGGSRGRAQLKKVFIIKWVIFGIQIVSPCKAKEGGTVGLRGRVGDGVKMKRKNVDLSKAAQRCISKQSDAGSEPYLIP